MTGLDLTAIAGRVPEWYAAPWTYDFEGDQWWVGYATDNPLAGLIATVPDYGERLAEFIAHAREDIPALLAEVQRLTAELAAMTELHDQKHRDWQMADNARQGLLVDRTNLRADLQLYEPARHGDASYWVHACGFVEVWSGDWTPTDGGCDACESGSDLPADWQPLYIRRGGEPS
jgi:hypothetical protein